MEKYTVDEVADLVEGSDVETESESEIEEDASFSLPQYPEDEEDPTFPAPEKSDDEDSRSSWSSQTPILQGFFAKKRNYTHT